MSNNKNFQGILARAQQLMLSEDFNRAVERSASLNKGKMNSDDISYLEAQAFGRVNETASSAPVINEQQAFNKNNINLDRLPAGLRESFAQTPPMSGGVLDPKEMPDISPLGQIAENLSIRQQPVQQVNEQARPTQNATIDYSLIKAIIDESVKRNLEAMNRKMLNENTVKGFHIGAGNKVQFVTNKGDLYEGVLTLKKKKS